MPTKVPTHRKVRENRYDLVCGKVYRGTFFDFDPHTFASDGKVAILVLVDRAQFPDEDGSFRSTPFEKLKVEMVVKDAH